MYCARSVRGLITRLVLILIALPWSRTLSAPCLAPTRALSPDEFVPVRSRAPAAHRWRYRHDFAKYLSPRHANRTTGQFKVIVTAVDFTSMTFELFSSLSSNARKGSPDGRCPQAWRTLSTIFKLFLLCLYRRTPEHLPASKEIIHAIGEKAQALQ